MDAEDFKYMMRHRAVEADDALDEMHRQLGELLQLVRREGLILDTDQKTRAEGIAKNLMKLTEVS